MPAHAKKHDSLEATLEIIGDKWTLLLIRSLGHEPLPFCRLECSLEGISPRTLSQRLEMLENEKIITKRQYCKHPVRHKYLLTKKGHDLQNVLNSMSRWGMKHASSSRG